MSTANALIELWTLGMLWRSSREANVRAGIRAIIESMNHEAGIIMKRLVGSR